ncbi:hypothetical protein COEREDRAFT_12035 [Coemansia reversa NRRL 1564]|uniref:Fungal-type protein kinase domain-containing protein n=1 Tax=Coemansia reversa (strain ATCC 12441 / NRRL 1564) TaxID=763665 RepID=A0A2G5B1L7_COERN|nr:hypothetical protein COEREDRAFT_12035 [Coemansia reversa NRRL 1564]|eukprot:PIA12894.1 hypothetical protein COEREDRAFT_12035 [Coemansia reversa NRRL 1564]
MPAQMPRTEDELRVVTFLLFLYKQSLQDCGYLTGRDSDYPSTFLLEDVIGATTNIKGNSLKSTSISLECHNNEHRVLGRHRYLKGQRTWLYPAMYDKDRHPSFFKFQWGFEGEGEISAHEFVQNRGIPNVPKLHYGASIAGNGGKTGRQKYVGEVIVMEDVGETIMSVFDKSTLAMSEAKIINIFAGYAHTLIAAAIVDDNKKFVLHRDISTGNLTVQNNRPFIIDWGCGRVCIKDECRTSSAKELIGTTIYMGIRVLKGYRTRSVIDDLESLFLVLCHCLWKSIGEKNEKFRNLYFAVLQQSEDDYIDEDKADRDPKRLRETVVDAENLRGTSVQIGESCATKEQRRSLKEALEALDGLIEEMDQHIWELAHKHLGMISTCRMQAQQNCHLIKAGKQQLVLQHQQTLTNLLTKRLSKYRKWEAAQKLFCKITEAVGLRVLLMEKNLGAMVHVLWHGPMVRQLSCIITQEENAIQVYTEVAEVELQASDYFARHFMHPEQDQLEVTKTWAREYRPMLELHTDHFRPILRQELDEWMARSSQKKVLGPSGVTFE